MPTAVFADDGGYTTQSFDTRVQVQQNHAYQVTETIKVHFNEPRHGIYRYIPTSGTFYRQINGKQTATDYHARVKNVSVDGKNYNTDTDDGNLVIQIGDEDQLVSGNQTYVIHYTWDPGDDGIASFDDFYFNVMPHRWPTAIKQATFHVTMPKAFDRDNLHAYTGQYGSTTSKNLSLSVQGLAITGQVENLNANEGVTVNLRLPKDYYTGAWTLYDYVPLAVVVAIICLIVGIVLFIRFCRDTKPVTPVTFYAPHGFDSALTGTIIDGKADKEEILSMLIYLASKGYLKIEQTGKTDFTFTKLKEIPEDSPDYAQLIFRTLFPKNTTIRTSEEAAEGFSGIVTSAEGMVERTFEGDKRLFTKTSSRVKNGLMAFAILILLAFSFMLCFASEGQLDITIFFAIFCFMGLLPYWAYRKLTDGIAGKAGQIQKKVITHSIGWSVLSVILTIVGIIISALILNGHDLGVVVLCYAIVFILSWLTAFATKRTPQGNTWLGEVLGFKHFLTTAEKPRIDKLVEENPNYFFDVLPYAYVLGVTDAWAKRFEGMTLTPPTWYVTYEPYSTFNAIWFAHSLNHCMSGIRSSMITVPSNAGSGGFGSGFGSGGGFSGGGGGGGGGGSW